MEQTGFGVKDLRTILNLIQIVSSRGAIKPDEMSVVGDLYTRVSDFVAKAEAEVAKKAQTDSEGETK